MATLPNPKEEKKQWKIRYYITKVNTDGTVQKVRRTKCLGRVQDMTFHQAQREAILFLSQPTNQKNTTTHTMTELIDHWLSEMEDFTDLGVNVLLVEFPGYGHSEGKPTRATLRETFT